MQSACLLLCRASPLLACLMSRASAALRGSVKAAALLTSKRCNQITEERLLLLACRVCMLVLPSCWAQGCVLQRYHKLADLLTEVSHLQELQSK